MLEGVKFLLEHPEAGIFLDPGLRKTSITLGALRVLRMKKMIKRTLVVAPLRVCMSVWPREVAKWEDFADLKCVILHGDKKDQLLEEDADIYLINPEGLDWLLDAKRVKDAKGKVHITYDTKKFLKLKIDVLVIDEVSKFKHYNSGRSQAIHSVLHTFKRRIGLTGTPASNGLLDLFGVMFVIDMGKSLGRFITHYRMNFFRPTGYGGYTWVPQKGAEQAIYDRIAPYVFRLADKDYLKLPEIVENIIKVELPPKARKMYDEIEEDFLTQLDDRVITATNAGAAAIQCRQVANGGLYHPRPVDLLGRKSSKRTWSDLHTAKIEAVEDLLDELNGAPALIAYDFEHDLARLLKLLGKDTPVIGGGVTAKQSDIIVANWNAGKYTRLLGHPQAMAHGLNMQEGNAAHIIFHSLTYDYELYDQLIRRLRRSGNTALRVFVHLIVAKDTVDEAMLIALRKKKRTQSSLLDALREYSLLRLETRIKRGQKKIKAR